MEVQATSMGFYLSVRYPNDVFVIPDELFDSSWMTQTVQPALDAGPEVDS